MHAPDARKPTTDDKPMAGDKPIMRSLGEFFGHVWKAVTHDPTPPERREVSRRVVEQSVESGDGKVTLRRTIVEEIELPRKGH
jgi:hypothetical protein